MSICPDGYYIDTTILRIKIVLHVIRNVKLVLVVAAPYACHATPRITSKHLSPNVFQLAIPINIKPSRRLRHAQAAIPRA